MKNQQFTEKAIAAAAAIAVSFGVVSAVLSVAEHERDQAVFLAAHINPQHLAASEIRASAR